MRRIALACACLFLAVTASHATIEMSWTYDDPMPPGVVHTGFQMQACQAPSVTADCAPVDVAGAVLPASARSWSENPALMKRFCYGVVALGTGAERPRSEPSNTLCLRHLPVRDGWTRCAIEGETCAFVGTQEVSYGVGQAYVSKILQGGTPCTNNVFDDPAVGAKKACFIRNPQVPAAKQLRGKSPTR